MGDDMDDKIAGKQLVTWEFSIFSSLNYSINWLRQSLSFLVLHLLCENDFLMEWLLFIQSLNVWLKKLLNVTWFRRN